MARYLYTHFSVQYLFGCIIKSTYLGDVPKAKSWDVGVYTGLWWAVQVLELKWAVLGSLAIMLPGSYMVGLRKKIIIQPSVVHKVAKTSSKKVF